MPHSLRRTPLLAFRNLGSRCLCAVFLILSLFSVPLTAQNSPQRRKDLRDFQDQYQKIRTPFVQEIRKLVEDRESAGDESAATQLRSLEQPIDREQLRGRALPESVRQELSSELPVEERAWRSKLHTLRSEHATALFQLARQAGQKKLVSFAFDLLHEALFHDPDHAGARRVFGYRKIDDLWLTSFAAEMRRKKHVWHDRYGWLPVEFVPRYDNGERYFQGRWMPAEKEQALREKIQNAWVVRTEHFDIRTNHSLEMGVRLARELEAFNSAFFAAFAASFTPPEQLRQLQNGGNAPAVVLKPHRVHYYRTREEYLKTCQPKMPVDIGITLGLYIPGDQISYFFHPEDPETDVRRTLVHEATHQLFSETRPSPHPVALNANFWIIEGIACYMESYKPLPDGFSIGDPAYIRFQNARDRRLGRPDLEPYYRPLAQFVSLGQVAYQRDPQQRANYSQGSGLTHFFMHFQDGLYREDFIEHLSDVYSRNPRVRAAPPSIEELTNVPFNELDRQYLDYMREQAKELQNLNLASPVAEEIEDVSGAEASPNEIPNPNDSDEE